MDQKMITTLQWIIGILNRLGIPHQVAGGLAAKCYGSSRPLHDIDFYVPHEAMPMLKKKLSDYIEFGPERYTDEHWNIVFMKLRYKGQIIEFGDADRTRYVNSATGKWIKESIDFSVSEMVDFEGIKLPIMPKSQLITYKKRLNREVDRMDLKEML